MVATMQVGCGPSTLNHATSTKPSTAAHSEERSPGGAEGGGCGKSSAGRLSDPPRAQVRVFDPSSNVGETTANMRATQAGGRKNLGLGMLEPLFLVKAAITPSSMCLGRAYPSGVSK